MTHGAFAERTGLSRNSMYAALNGGDVRVSTLQRMADALEVPIVVLLGGEAVQAKPEPAQGMNPAIVGLLSGMMSGQSAAVDVPTSAAEFLSLWKRLDARSLSALLALAKSLAANREVEATYTEHRRAVNK